MPDLMNRDHAVFGHIDMATIKHHVAPWLVRRYGDAKVAMAEYVRRAWSAEISRLYLINDRRFQAVLNVLEAGMTVKQIVQAIKAYGKARQSRWYQDHAEAGLSFERFFESGAVEQWLARAEGREKRVGKIDSEEATRAAERRAAEARLNAERSRREKVRAWLAAKPETERAALVAQAVRLLGGHMFVRGIARRNPCSPLILDALVPVMMEELPVISRQSSELTTDH